MSFYCWGGSYSSVRVVCSDLRMLEISKAKPSRLKIEIKFYLRYLFCKQASAKWSTRESFHGEM